MTVKVQETTKQSIKHKIEVERRPKRLDDNVNGFIDEASDNSGRIGTFIKREIYIHRYGNPSYKEVNLTTPGILKERITELLLREDLAKQFLVDKNNKKDAEFTKIIDRVTQSLKENHNLFFEKTEKYSFSVETVLFPFNDSYSLIRGKQPDSIWEGIWDIYNLTTRYKQPLIYLLDIGRKPII